MSFSLDETESRLGVMSDGISPEETREAQPGAMGLFSIMA
jgi:hypothetical protein